MLTSFGFWRDPERKMPFADKCPLTLYIIRYPPSFFNLREIYLHVHLTQAGGRGEGLLLKPTLRKNPKTKMSFWAFL